MRITIFALFLLASASAAYAGEPTSHPTRTEKAPAPDVKAPQSLVVVACQVDDVTGQPGRHGVDEEGNYHPEWAGRGWRDLELHLDKGLEYVCKRERLDLEDAVAANYPSKPSVIAGMGGEFGLNPSLEQQAPVTGELYATPLDPNFGDWGQCVRVGVVKAQEWNEANPGYAVVGVGCPVPIVNNDGRIVGWTLPGCPTYLPGTSNRMKCRFDSSAV